MKRIIKYSISCLMVVLLTGLMLYGLTQLTKRTEGNKFREYQDIDEPVDVLFLGTSHVINGVFPMELWNDFGITSYNLGSHAATIPTCYWILKNALDYQKPKVVVIDAYNWASDMKIDSIEYEYLYMAVEGWPLSKTKIDMVNDLLDDEAGREHRAVNGVEERSALDLLWTFTTYHSRWSQLGEESTAVDHSIEKGAEMRINVAKHNGHGTVDRNDKITEDMVGLDYLRKIIEECQAQDIQVLLTVLPFPANGHKQRSANRLYEIADEYGVRYVNFLTEKVAKLETDFYDPESHMNPSGARKVTNYLGQILHDEFGLADNRDNAAYADWNADYETFRAYKKDLLIKAKNLSNYLMLCYDNDYQIVIDCVGFETKPIKKMEHLLANLGVNTEKLDAAGGRVVIDEVRKAVYYKEAPALKENEEPHITIWVKDKQTNKTVDKVRFVIHIVEGIYANYIGVDAIKRYK